MTNSIIINAFDYENKFYLDFSCPVRSSRIM